jgi:hypothetical protein
MSQNLKELIVEYVGTHYDPEDDNVTVEMVTEVLANEFPELISLLAQENYINGYRSALDDTKAVHGQH